MIFIPVIWVSFDFRPYKKKSLKNIPVKKYLFEKGSSPHQNIEVAWFLPRGMSHNIKFLKIFLKF